MTEVSGLPEEDLKKRYNALLKEELIDMLIESQRLIKHMIIKDNHINTKQPCITKDNT